MEANTTEFVSESFLANESISAYDINEEFRGSIYPVSIIMGLFGLAGLVGNSFVLYIHLFRYKHNTFRYFILGLGFIDLICSVTIIPMEIFTHMVWFVYPYECLCKVKAFMTLFISLSSAYILLMIAVDRYRRVCVPHGWQLNKRSILRTFAVCAFFACIQSVPVLLLWGKQHTVKSVKGFNVTITFCSVAEMYKDTIWPYLTSLLLVPMPIGATAMLVLYGIVACRIHGISKSSSGNFDMAVKAIESFTDEGKEKKMIKSIPEKQFNIQDEPTVKEQTPRDRIVSDFTTDSSIDRLRLEVESSCLENSDVIIYNIKDGEVKVKCSPKEEIEPDSSICVTIPTEEVKFTLDERNSQDEQSSSTDSGDVDEENAVEIPRPTYQLTFQKSSTFSQVSRVVQQGRRPKVTNLRTRTLMTFIFSVVFIVTFVTYLIFQGHVVNANSRSSLSIKSLVIFQLFYRIYFINCVIHPVIYGFLDPSFRRTLRTTSRRVFHSVRRSNPSSEETSTKDENNKRKLSEEVL